MTETPSETAMGIWQVPEYSLPIEYSTPILDEIRRLTVDAFFSLPHGGAEIGGILFGTHREGKVRILAFRPMACEHAHGPGFVFSDKDRTQLSVQLEQLQRDPAWRGMEVVGWYHSHTRSEIFLSDLDLDLYREFFPLPWQVALVLRPNGMKPTRAAFFFREAHGTIRSSASYREFIVGAPTGANLEPGAAKKLNRRNAVPAPAATAIATPAARPAPSPAGRKSSPAPDERRHPPPAEAVAASAAPDAGPPSPPESALLPHAEALPARRLPEVNQPVGTQQAEFVLPTFLTPPEPARSRHWLWVSLLLVIGLAAAGYFTSSYWMQFLEHKPVNLHLQAIERAGQLEIQWDREALATKHLTGGAVEIVDGPFTTIVPLDPVAIRSGSLQYVRRSQMVEVHLTVQTGSGVPLEEFTSFIGQKPSRPPSPTELSQQQAAELAAEAEKARGDLKKQELRTLQLEESLRKMQALQRAEEERRRAEKQTPSNAPPPAGESKSVPRSPQPNPGTEPSDPAGASPPPSAAPPTQETPQSSLTGSWVFSSATKTGSPFPPESVTLILTEVNGQVRGLLVGRYRVPKNRKLNPSVKFSFQGPVRQSKFPFTAAGGLKGEIELIRLPNKQDAIEVVWYSERDKLTFDDIFFRKP